MAKLQALIFDVDGTLADTERDGHRVAFNKAFIESGLDWHWSVEQYGQLLAITGGKERIHAYIKASLPHFKTNDLQGLIAELHEVKTTFYRQLLSTGKIPMRPGVKRLLLEAREKNYRLAIATTTTLENVYALFAHALDLHAPDWFEVIAAGDIVEAKKPAADIYLYAMEKLELTADACLAFEDSRNGLLSAVQSGLRTVVTINGYTYDHDFTGALAVIDHFGEPGKSFKLITGEVYGHSFVNIDLLENWYQKNTPPKIGSC